MQPENALHYNNSKHSRVGTLRQKPSLDVRGSVVIYFETIVFRRKTALQHT